MKRGTQIIYVPGHADGPDDSQAEAGFVTSYTPGFAFCRYWSKAYPGELRTKANSERTPECALVVQDTVDQTLVEEMLEQYC